MAITKIEVHVAESDDAVVLHDGWDDFRIVLASVTLQRVPRSVLERLHAEIGTALDTPCRPRTADEMLAGHTRAALNLLA